ncbi:hypothetical protein D623_10003522 [Myotis brandtii]|uniref:Uncharacterized protein n=1 Tax=Myotis brandtii TaxID=109478 RepID=S7PDF3_MYOBR|nr:hypothetical protein D623_10003522 [Myotis brandtii]
MMSSCRRTHPSHGVTTSQDTLQSWCHPHSTVRVRGVPGPMTPNSVISQDPFQPFNHHLLGSTIIMTPFPRIQKAQWCHHFITSTTTMASSPRIHHNPDIISQDPPQP